MKEFAILSLVGKDRPGIVDEVSSFLYERGANIEDSRMAVMGGRFSIMMLFSCASKHLEKIKTDLDDLRAHSFDASLHRAENPAAVPGRPQLPLKLEVTAMDHPGIVQKVVAMLHRHDVNIVSLDTKVVSAPLSGAPLFDLFIEAAVPAKEPLAAVKEELATLAADMNLDLTFLR